MTVVALIQARLNSTRFPRKILAPLGPDHKPIIRWVVERAMAIGCPTVVCCPVNDAPPIIGICRDLWGERLACWPSTRPENDVLGRLTDAVRATVYPRSYLDDDHIQFVLRITADSPFIDPYLGRRLIETAMMRVRMQNWVDYLAPCYPAASCADGGLDMELVSYTALRAADQQATDPEDREHPTRYIWMRPGLFVCDRFPEPKEYGTLGVRWMVDTREDLARLQRIAHHLPPQTTGWQETLDAERSAGWTGE